MVYNRELAMGIPFYFGPLSNHDIQVLFLMIICRCLYVKDYFINSGWDLDFLSLYLPQEIIHWKDNSFTKSNVKYENDKI